ncbi:MAG: CcmD family protein [Acidobacteriia bacterium]|nr:CcmD family protein [Terriglobia bacterium]
MLNRYLFLAFSFLWLIFFVYVWSLSRRQARLRKDLEDLRSKLPVASADGTRPR